MAYKMQLSLAKLCGLLDIPAKYPKSWEVVVGNVDSVLAGHWQQKESLGSFVDRGIWVQTNRDAVSVVIKNSDFDGRERACEKNADCPGQELQSVLQTSLGQALFHKEARQYQMHCVMERCAKRAVDLMHLGLTEENIQGDNDRAAVECRTLPASGHKMFNKNTPRTIPYLNQKVEVYKTSVCDLKDWISLACARSIPISDGQLARLPWEAVL